MAQTSFIKIVRECYHPSGVPFWCHIFEAGAPGQAQIRNLNSLLPVVDLSGMNLSLFFFERTAYAQPGDRNRSL